MNKIYKFSEFILDQKTFTFYRQNLPIHLSSRAFEILLYLIERRSEIVEKNEILEKIWQDSFVEEANLPVHISALRRVLQEKKGESRFIKTISGRGYSFIAEIEEIESPQNLNILFNTEKNEQKNISIAVLPFTFENISEENQFLANSITQSLISDLSQIEDLHVLAYSAVKPYKNSELQMQEIGFLLDADKILTGSISAHKNNLEIVVELVNVNDKRCLWGTSHVFEANDIFYVKKQISTTISETLKLKLVNRKPADLAEINHEAQKYYYRGKAVLESRGTKDSLDKVLSQALNFFNEAVKIEPLYALAYIGIGTVYVSMHNHNIIDRETAYFEANKALNTAFDLNDELSEAYILKGSTELMFDWNFIKAERSFDQAIKFNSNNPNAYHWKSMVCMGLSKFGEAISLEECAVKFDPTTGRFSDNLTRIFYFSGNFDKSIVHANEMLEFNENNLVSHLFKSLSYIAIGEADLALQSINKFVELRKNPESLLMQACVCALAKKGKLAKEILINVVRSYPKSEIDEANIALVYAGLNDFDNAFEHLYKAFEEKSAGLMFFPVDHRYQALRDDERYKVLINKIKLK